jgi:hypothetical protein
MLTRVKIENYRCFKSYSVEDLSQINLFVGKNNSGKTALLEGIQFLMSAGDPAALYEAAVRRGELVLDLANPPNYRRRDVLVDIEHLFDGHNLSPDSRVTFSGDDGLTPVHVDVKTHSDEVQNNSQENELSGLTLLITTTQSIGSKRVSDFRITADGGVDFKLPPLMRLAGVRRRSYGQKVLFVEPNSIDSRDLAVMWDEITVKGLDTDVTEAMRVIEPGLDSVRFLSSVLSSGYSLARGGIAVGLNGQDARVPLGSMGDGMHRLLALATSLAFTTEGSLFVDEIDTGLHYSVMPDMWNLVISKAIASSTQVFATTHSWDCLEGLSLLCQREPKLMSSVAVHKIDRQIPHSVAFSGESLVRMVKSDIDPR